MYWNGLELNEKNWYHVEEMWQDIRQIWYNMKSKFNRSWDTGKYRFNVARELDIDNTKCTKKKFTECNNLLIWCCG